MTKLDTRLDKIEANLTPKQMVLQLIEQVQQYDSLDECALRFTSRDWKILDSRKTEQFYEALRARLKAQKKDPEVIYSAIQKAGAEMMFLYVLFVRVSGSFIKEKYRHSYNRLYLDNLLHLMQPLRNDEPGERIERIGHTMKEWKHRATRHLYHLYSEKYIAEEISRRYFEGRNLLFKADKALLESMITTSQNLIALVDGAIRKDKENALGMADTIVDPESVELDVREHLDELVKQEVDLAKAEVYHSLDKHDKGFAIMAEYAEQELDRLGALFCNESKA